MPKVFEKRLKHVETSYEIIKKKSVRSINHHHRCFSLLPVGNQRLEISNTARNTSLFDVFSSNYSEGDGFKNCLMDCIMRE